MNMLYSINWPHVIALAGSVPIALKGGFMSAYSLDVLIRKWGRGELTVEQVLGQTLLHIQELQNAITALEYQLHRQLAQQNGETEDQPTQKSLQV